MFRIEVYINLNI